MQRPHLHQLAHPVKDGTRQDICAIPLLQNVDAWKRSLGILHASDRILSRVNMIRVDERLVRDIRGGVPFLDTKRGTNLLENVGELGLRHTRCRHCRLE